MSIVSVWQTEKYDPQVLRASIDHHFETLGIESDLRSGMKVLIKPNLLAAHRPERTATTHPAVVMAIVLWLRERGVYDITIADSPGGLYKQGNLKAVYESCGYMYLQEVAQLNYDTGYQAVMSPEGFRNESFNIIKPVIEADFIINVAKLKTHGLTVLSAGIKNLFGTIPGLQKPELHFKYPNINDFCRMLIELAQVVGPQVTVIDAVETMEGNGPLNGRPRHQGLTMASRNMFALDYYAAELIGLTPDDIPLLCHATELDLVKPKEIEIQGFAALPADPPYIVPESIVRDNKHNFLLRAVGSIMKRVYIATPLIDTQKCVGCGKCAESCPMKIISITNKKAGMSIKHCISCFCCQEMCPFDAVKIRHVFRLPRL